MKKRIEPELGTIDEQMKAAHAMIDDDPVEFDITKLTEKFFDTEMFTRPGEDIIDAANPKQAFGDKKVPLQLAPPCATALMCIGLREGVIKYGAWNFRDTKVEMMTYLGAIKRHLDALLEGEWIDEDDIVLPDGTVVDWIPKKPHLAGLLASAAIIADAWYGDFIVDNRPPPNKGYSELMESMKKIT